MMVAGEFIPRSRVRNFIASRRDAGKVPPQFRGMNAPATLGRPSRGFTSLKQFSNRTLLGFSLILSVSALKPLFRQ
jgi:hypothetical protein